MALSSPLPMASSSPVSSAGQGSPTSFRPSMQDALAACSLSESDRAERCAYPSKPCPHPRATKLNGDRHNFCNFHRKKANMNQRRWQQRRRRTRHIGGTAADAAGDQSPTSPSSSHNGVVVPLCDMETARTVAMLHQSMGHYSPVPAHAWPRLSMMPTNQHWSPSPRSHAAAPFRLNMPPPPPPAGLAYGMGYSGNPTSSIPPLRALPPLLPSAFLPAKQPPVVPREMAAHVHTC